MPVSYEPRFSREMRKLFPILRGFENKLRGKFVVPPQDPKITQAKRKERKLQAKKRKVKDALHRAQAQRNKRKRLAWWI